MYDEQEVTLADGSRRQPIVIVDEASKYVVATPLGHLCMPTTEAVLNAIEHGWISWVSIPEALVFDLAKPHIADTAKTFCSDHGFTPVPTPAEYHDTNPVVEERFCWKAHSSPASEQLQITEPDGFGRQGLSGPNPKPTIRRFLTESVRVWPRSSRARVAVD